MLDISLVGDRMVKEDMRLRNKGVVFTVYFDNGYDKFNCFFFWGQCHVEERI